MGSWRVALTDDQVTLQRERACQAAIKLYGKHGPSGISLRPIAAELGYTAMALYRYFPGGKDDLLAAVRTLVFARLADSQESAAKSTDDPKQRLFNLGNALVQFVEDEPNMYRLLFDPPQFEDGSCPELDQQVLRGWTPLGNAVADAVEAGLLVGEPNALASMFFACLHGVIALHLSGESDPGKSLDALVRPTMETLWRGSAPRSVAPARIARALYTDEADPETVDKVVLNRI